MKIDARLKLARKLGHPARVDYSVDGVEWNMWCYTSKGSGVDLVIDCWFRLVRLYPDWQFRLVIGGGL